MMRSISYCIFFALVLAACKKDKEPDPVPQTTDTSFPVITLSAPIENAIYHNGDTLFINGTVTDNSLHEASIEIKDDTTAQVYFTAAPYVHGLTGSTITYSWIVNVTHNAASTMTFTCSDHAPNVSVKTVHLTFLL